MLSEGVWARSATRINVYSVAEKNYARLEEDLLESYVECRVIKETVKRYRARFEHFTLAHCPTGANRTREYRDFCKVRSIMMCGREPKWAT